MSSERSPARSTPPPNSSPPTPTHHSSTQQRSGHAHSHSHLSGLSSSTGTTTNNSLHSRSSEQQQRYRASVDTMGTAGGGGSARNWGSASIRPTGHNERSTVSGGGNGGVRPSSELLQGSASLGAGSSNSNFASPETEAIDRWFEDLQHYEATLEEMATASLDANFKEELSAIEQWFRVLSEAERTAALYSLLQSSTQVQMRFFVTVLQQMARADPMTALLSPSNPGQLSMEDQMEAKLASMGLKSPASPAMRQFARQSLGAPISSANEPYLSPHSATITTSNSQDDASAAALASQRAKLKANARISAPANILLGASGVHHESMKSPLWNEKERVAERRSPSPNRPKSTGSNLEAQPNGAHSGQHLSHSAGPPSSASFLRSPLPTQTDFEQGQLSPALGGSWASMVNTPLVPMFGSKDGVMEQGNFGGITSPALDGANARLGNWQSGRGAGTSAEEGIVLDDVRKFRRSARISGSSTTGFGGVNGGALGGMYDENNHQHQPQGSSRNISPSAQQNAINLGLAGLMNQQQVQQQGLNRSGATSPGLLSPQHAALSAQQNWRNGLSSPNANSSHGEDQFSQQQQLTGFGIHQPHLNSSNPLSANAQLANLIALQQQMMQQQQQFQQLNLAAAAGIALTPVQLLSLQQQQQQVRMMGMAGMGMMGGGGGGGSGGGYGMGIGMGGMNTLGSPRRSPRPNDRSPGMGSHPSPVVKSSSLPSTTGSGSNPDEPIDVNLLSDVASWLRSLRLHKYTTNFEGDNWREMVLLDDVGLENKGVSALGARRKLLKVFETVREKMGISLPGEEGRGGVGSSSVRSGSPVEERDD